MVEFTVNGKQYIAENLMCSHGIGIYDVTGTEITTIPSEPNWFEVATTAITCVDNLLARKARISTSEPALAA